MSKKQMIDIEALLILAFRDRQIDKWRERQDMRPKLSVSPGSPMRRIAELGTMVQSSGVADRPITTVIPDEYADMLAVYDAVLLLDDFYAEFQTETRIRLWTRGAAGEQSGEIATSGAGIHRGFELRLPNRSPRPLRPLAASALIVSHARSATRPDCFEDWRPKRGRKAFDAGIEAREVALARASYQVWLSSLQWLAEHLDGALACYDVTATAAPSEPWNFSEAA